MTSPTGRGASVTCSWRPGEAQYADLIERTTFNALPGAVTKDFKQLQYFSAVNQMEIAATNSRLGHWPTRMTYRAAHDTECCAGNINRAMPNYVIRMWMRANDGGLAAVYYGPSEVSTTVGGRTDYHQRGNGLSLPRHAFRFGSKPPAPVTFNLQLRIPALVPRCRHSIERRNLATEEQKPGTFVSAQKRISRRRCGAV